MNHNTTSPDLKIGYKVVAVRNGKLRSAFIKPKIGGVVYQLGQTTVPKIKGTKLFAFSTQRAALEYGTAKHEKVFKAVLLNAIPAPMLPAEVRKQEMRDFCAASTLEAQEAASKFHLCSTNMHTVLADAVLLLEEVPRLDN